MRPTHDLDLILGSQLKVRVLRALMRLAEPVSGRHAGRLASVSVKAIGALDELAGMGIIRKAESTGQHLYSVNRDHYLAESLERLFEIEGTKMSLIHDSLRGALTSQPGVLVGAVFGSVARDAPTPRSDLDVLVVIDKVQSSTEVRDALISEGDALNTTYGSRVSPVVMIAERWLELIAGGDSFAASIRADARVFLGSWSDIDS